MNIQVLDPRSDVINHQYNWERHAKWRRVRPINAFLHRQDLLWFTNGDQWHCLNVSNHMIHDSNLQDADSVRVGWQTQTNHIRTLCVHNKDLISLVRFASLLDRTEGAGSLRLERSKSCGVSENCSTGSAQRENHWQEAKGGKGRRE